MPSPVRPLALPVALPLALSAARRLVRPLTRPSAIALLLAPLALTACVEGGTTAGGQPVSAAQSCATKAVRLVKVPRDSITVTQSLPYPEGEVVTLAVAGMGTLRCLVDVTGKTGDLVWIDGGPARPAPAPAG